MSHTPGPWARNISPAWKYPIYEEKNHNKIACVIKDPCISEEEQEANLNLIVAAPELLEALEELLFAMTMHGYPAEVTAINLAKSAITKAKGESL